MKDRRRRWGWILLVGALLCGIAGAVWGMSVEFYVDPSSGVRMRGFPIVALQYPPYWESPRRWSLSTGFFIDVFLWALPPYLLGRLGLWVICFGSTPAREWVCPECGYDLRGLPMPRCPECGADAPAGWRKSGQGAKPGSGPQGEP